MDLIHTINVAKKLTFQQLIEYDDLIQSHPIQLDDFIREIYSDLIIYYKLYLKHMAVHITSLLQDKQEIHKQRIELLRQQIDTSVLSKINDKMNTYIRHQPVSFIKIICVYFMVNIPMNIHLYNEKLNKLYRIVEKQ